MLSLVLLAATVTAPAPDAFNRDAKPMLAATCTLCHNNRMMSGNLDLKPLLAASSMVEHRETWEKVLRKVRSGEMPPKEIERPAQGKIDTFTKYIEDEFDRQDKLTPQDPGRVVAHRLNRIEYTN